MTSTPSFSSRSFCIFLLNFCVTFEVLHSQVRFNKLFGSPNEDIPWAVRARSDSGCVIVGETHLNGTNADILAFALDRNGSSLWSKRFGGDAREYVRDAILTVNSSLLIAGWSQSLESQGDVYVSEVDASGNLLWTSSVGLQANEWAQSILLTSDDSLVVIGQATTPSSPGNQQPFILKMGRQGQPKWMRVVFTGIRGTARSVVELSDGGFLISGWAYPGSDSDILLMKVDGNGMVQWCRRAGGFSNEDAIAMAKSPTGSIYIVGNTMSYGAGSGDIFLLKVDELGQVLWGKTIGGGGYDRAHSVGFLSDGQLLLSGETSSYSAARRNGFLAQCDTLGNVITFNLISSVNPSNHALGIGLVTSSAFPNHKGSVVLASDDREGAGGLDLVVATADSTGRILSGDSLVTPTVSDQSFPFTDFSYTLGPAFTLSKLNNVQNAVLVETMRSLSIATAVKDPIPSSLQPAQYELDQNFPNPFNPTTNIEFEISKPGVTQIQIFSADGRLVETLALGQLTTGRHRVDWKPGGLASGTYFYRLVSGNYVSTKKMTFIK